MKKILAFACALSLAGCGQIPNACPSHLKSMQEADLYFGPDIGGAAAVSEEDWQRFVEAEIAPRFPNGFTVEDASGQWLDGGRHYRLTLPPDVPAKNFWSVIVYDPQTRSLLQTEDRYPSLNSLSGSVAANSDGSIDLHFGPEPGEDHNGNWIRTVPGKGWFTILRLYGPLDPWFDKTWRPGEIERID